MTGGGHWFEDAFREHYLTVYAHRDEAAARREAEFAVTALDLKPGDPVLDLACGWGRHSRALADCETRVTGVDLSLPLIERAQSEGGAPAYLRGDMRDLPFPPVFRAVLLFFTSFGYFRGEEDRRVLREIARVLRPGGGVLVDTMNREQVVKGLVPESEKEAEGIRIHERREISADGLRVLKHVRVAPPGEEPFTYTESVRLYAPEEAVALLEEAGFVITDLYGDLAGESFGPESPRLVLAGEAPVLRSEPLGVIADGNPRPDPSTAVRDLDREALAEVVRSYQLSIDAPAAAVETGDKLARPDAVCVVTGQQPGLLGGPIFTLAKALSALAWAERIEAEHGVPAVAVFWVASEDHDLDEVNRVRLLDATDAPHELSLSRVTRGPMLSEVRPGTEAGDLLQKAQALLPASEFAEETLATLAPPEGASLGSWFATILSRWLGGKGLVVVEPHLFRAAAAPLLELERETPGTIRDACGPGPLTIHDPPFFRVVDGRRVRPASPSELPGDPREVSWDVATRVLAQNLVLPVAGHVVGPSEARYCAQVAPAHERLGIPAPPLLPRAGLVLVEGKVEKALGVFGATVAGVLEGGEAALRQEELRPEEFDEALRDLEAAMRGNLADLQVEADKVDDVLLRKTMGAEKEMLRLIDRLRDHARKAMDRVTGRDAERREKVLAHLMPGGEPQERALSPVPFLCRHGLSLIDRLHEVVAAHPDETRAVYLSRRKKA